MPRPSRRDHLVRTALAEFSRNGFHGTGIERIREAAGVSKKTLYNHFRSKEELILAVLAYYDSAFRNDFARQVERAAPDPQQRPLAVFDVAEDWFSARGFFGCLFINAIGEHSADDSAIRRICKEFKRLMRDYLVELTRGAGLHDAERLADQLALLLEGAIVTAQVSQDPASARTAREAAAILIDSARTRGVG